jgi:hypothetical protein
MEQFLQLHEDGDAYRLFLTRIVERIVGRASWKRNSDKKPLSRFCTKSDEAFGLLLLENSYDRWSKMWEIQDYKNEKKQAPRSRYTNSGDTRGERGSNRKLEGWSTEGYQRFDALHKLVTADREKPSRATFEEALRVELEAERAGRRSRKKPRVEVSHVGSYPAHDFDDVLEGGINLALTNEQAKEVEGGTNSSKSSSDDENGKADHQTDDDDSNAFDEGNCDEEEEEDD